MIASHISITDAVYLGVESNTQFISNLPGGYHKNIWNPAKYLDVMLTVGQAWQMKLAPKFNMNSVLSITYWWIWLPLHRVPISIVRKLGVVQQWPTLPDVLNWCLAVIGPCEMAKGWTPIDLMSQPRHGLNFAQMPTSTKKTLTRTSGEPVATRWGPLIK